MAGTMEIRGHLELGLSDAFIGVTEVPMLGPGKVECPVCGERLRVWREEVEELAAGDSWWTATCPACDAALAAEVRAGGLELHPRVQIGQRRQAEHFGGRWSADPSECVVDGSGAS